MTQVKSTMSIRHALAFVAPLLAGVALMPAGCSASDDGSGPGENIDTFGLTYEEFKASVFQEPDTGVYIVNGDTVISTERELHDFYLTNIQQGALAVAKAGNVDAKWDDTKKLNITYCVSKSFNSNYDKVVTAMNEATGAWEAAANVNFVHLTEQDSSCTASNSKVVFDVRQVSGQPYLARAFFPNQSRSSRNVLIDTSSFGALGEITLAGILRHELGHTLGFRHEHTRPEAGTCFEDTEYRPLTEYDSNSVMHYPQCNGTNTGDLDLTDLDKKGASDLYGAPGGGQPMPPPSGGQCEHSKCASGTKLTASCDACVSKVIAADPYCGNTAWDGQCVSEVGSICGESCQAAPPSCAHSICKTGEKLVGSCDPCAAKIIAADPYCGSTSWDGVCVKQVSSVCKQTCN